MSDDLLKALGRQQRADLERGGEPSSADDDDASSPFDERERADLLDAVFARVDETAPAGSESDKVIPLAGRRRAPLIASVLAVAAAATLVWWAWPEPGPEHGPIAQVPEYTFTQLEGGIAEQRSDNTDGLDGPVPELELRPDSVIKWGLTPAEPTKDPIAVALLARSTGGETRFVAPIEAQISEFGGVRIRGPLDELVALTPGQWTITLFVAPLEQLPTDANDTEGDARWRTLTLRAIIVADE